MPVMNKNSTIIIDSSTKPVKLKTTDPTSNPPIRAVRAGRKKRKRIKAIIATVTPNIKDRTGEIPARSPKPKKKPMIPTSK